MTANAPNVLMIFPEFAGGSFWAYQDTCELVGAKYPAAPLGLITVAAMLPESWPVRLVNRNTETLREEDLTWADMVMTGGMLPQQADSLAIIRDCRKRGIPVVVGGPDATSSPHLFADADFRVLGEAEGAINDFIAAWRAGERSGTFEAPKFQVDIRQSPVPRYDLLTFDHYIYIGIQFSRGCPFRCEFCDIIELYGRVPRTKTADQVLAELDRLYELGYRGHVDFVDDNLIGNKKAVKEFLPHLKDWQERHRYPFELSTEASLNLADDPELLQMMSDANFFTVFVGIESPDPDVLAAAQKKQNTRRDIAESVHKIYGAGIFVVGGFIVGFDNESSGVDRQIIDVIEEAAIPVSMVGLLYALPNTQLTARLHREGRLHADHDVDDEMGDQCTTGLNFETLRPRADVLADYRRIVDAIYAPKAYFGRTLKVGRMLHVSARGGALNFAALRKDFIQFIRLAYGMTFRIAGSRWLFWKTLALILATNPSAAKQVAKMMALYVHLGPFSRYVSQQIGKQIADAQAGPTDTHPLPAPQAAE